MGTLSPPLRAEPISVSSQAWLRDNVPRALGLFTLATFVFRCDVVVLLGPLTLQLLLTR